MPGMNLSQSTMDEEEVGKQSLFDSGFIVSLSLILLSALTFGGLHLYIGSLDKKISVLDSELGGSTASLKGEHIDRVADFDARLNHFSANKIEFFETRDVFQKLENSILPGVVLEEFQYNAKDKTVTINGMSGDYRRLAEQIMTLKKEAIFSKLKVENIGRNNDDQVTFVLKGAL